MWLYAVFIDNTSKEVIIFADGNDLLGTLPEGEDFMAVLPDQDCPISLFTAYEYGIPAKTGIFDGGEYGRAVGLPRQLPIKTVLSLVLLMLK